MNHANYPRPGTLGGIIGKIALALKRRRMIITPRVGANAVIFGEEGKVLLTRREDNGLWCLPGGHMDLGEMVTETVIRETEEETGLVVEVERLVGLYSMPYPGYVYQNPRKQIVVATFVCRPVGGELRLSPETTEVGYFDPNDLPPDMLPGHESRIRDALSGRVVVR
ncbi:MAG: NUDIX domain-containing protein [Chloroflexi bacterium]|nr:NUDIX domain-containing protein [Chloroflexota bacterium]